MKHKLTICMVILALVALMVTPVSAATTFIQSDALTEIEVYDDGSYAVIETTVTSPSISTFATAQTKNASRTYTYYSAGSVKEWDFTVKGTFSYDGSTAKATAVSTSYNIYVTGWSLFSRDSSKSGAKVTATGNFKYKTMTKSTTIGLKCSPSGTISAA